MITKIKKNITKKNFLLLKKIIRKTHIEFLKQEGVKVASALSYYTVLSFVPLLGLVFSFASSFGTKSVLKNEIMSFFIGQKEVIIKIFSFVDNLIKNANGGIIAVVSILFLMYTIMVLMYNITVSFNNIWKVKIPKSFSKRITDYLAMFIAIPLVLITVTALTSYLKSSSPVLIKIFGNFIFIKNIFIFILDIIPFGLMFLFIYFIFSRIPEIKVSNKASLISSLFTSILCLLVQKLFIFFQVGASSYNQIYGSFIAIPLFFVWIQTGWTLLIYGAFLCKNLHFYLNELENEEKIILNPFLTKKYSILILKKIFTNFQNGKPPLKKTDLYNEFDHQNSIVNTVIEILINIKVISKVIIENKYTGYQPYSDLNNIKIYNLFNLLENNSYNLEDAINDEEYPEINKLIFDFFLELEKSKNNILIKDIELIKTN